LSNMLNMLFGILGEDQDIIQVYYHEGEISEKIVHVGHEDRGSIGETKRDDLILVKTSGCPESCLLHIFIRESDLVIGS